MFDPLQIPHVFRARSVGANARAVIATGFSDLDQALAGGWPYPALIEILLDVYGIGELQLIMPLLRTLIGRAPQSPLTIWLNPPHCPNAVALAQHQLNASHWVANGLSDRDVLWAAEKSLRSNACSAVFAWAATPSLTSLRRLKLAAMESNCVGILFRSSQVAIQPSPANLRLVLRSSGTQLSIEIIKHEGRKPTALVLDVRSKVENAP